MATFCPSSAPIKFSDIKNAFGLTSVSLAARRSQIYWKADAYKGTLPAAAIKLSDFYGKGGTSPVVASSLYLTANNGTTQGATLTYSYTVPLYYQLVIDCRAAGGGGAGGDSYGVSADSGSNGENTSFGTYNTAYGGTGGAHSANGAKSASGAGSDHIALGGSGGNSGYAGTSSGGAGGDGGYNEVIVLSPVNGGSGPQPGAVITVTVGKGGSGSGGATGIKGGIAYTGGSGSPGRYGEFAVYVS